MPTVLIAALASLAACSPARHPYGPGTADPALLTGAVVAVDGVHLPLRVWSARGLRPGERPRAVILALHGMNDYSGAFRMPAGTWRERGIAVYAYDQRGFGGGPKPGIWPGVRNLVRDLRTTVAALKRRHPGVPVYLVGESMGGAVILAAMGAPNPPKVAGVVLSAPAVWARSTMPAFYKFTLRLAYRTVPSVTLSGSGLGRRPTDNLAVWRATAYDPLIIRGARIDAIWGVVNLMDAAAAAAPKLAARTLLIYGARDQIIPKGPTRRLVAGLPKGALTFVYYPDGWHWLFRDRQRWLVHDDVSAWILKRRILSGWDRDAAKRLARDASQ